MKIGMIGLGRMGAGMAQRLIRKGHECVVYDAKSAAVASLKEDGATGAASMQEMVAQMARPRAIWLMIPAAMVDHALNDLVPLLAPDDIIIDGGNSYYRDDMRRAAELKARGIHYLDVGTSGGVAGIDRGYCLMIGGEAETVAHLRPIFSSLAPGMAVAARTLAGMITLATQKRVPALRRAWRRSFCQDDPQRHRIWPDGGVRRGLQYSAQCQCGQANAKRRCGDDTTTPSGVLPI